MKKKRGSVKKNNNSELRVKMLLFFLAITLWNSVELSEAELKALKTLTVKIEIKANLLFWTSILISNSRGDSA